MSAIGFWQIAQDEPGRTALITPEGRAVAASELLEASNQIVHGLRAQGLKPGDSIAMLCKNTPEMIELFLAATQAGWYITPINSHLVGPEVAYIVNDDQGVTGAEAIFAPGATLEELAELKTEGVPLLTDVDPGDVERLSALTTTVDEIVTRPVRSDNLAKKLKRALRKSRRGR